MICREFHVVAILDSKHGNFLDGDGRGFGEVEGDHSAEYGGDSVVRGLAVKLRKDVAHDLPSDHLHMHAFILFLAKTRTFNS